MLSFQNFSKSYSDQLVLSIDQLTLAPGVYWVRGENGSGKSTLFKSLAGILPFDGDITFSDSLSLKHHPVDFRKRVNYSEAEPVFPGFLTSKDLIRFVGKTKKAPLEQQDYFTDRLGIRTFFDKACDAYSSGMMKKLSLALAFLGTPKIIILDEPLITLDEQTRGILISLIREVNQKKDIITLLSSHQSLDLPDLAITKAFEIKDKTLVEL
jgi:ABC-2 type transport system ATP-binding protein